MMHSVLLTFLLVFVTSRGQQCRNEYGEPVDWFYLYKMPKLQQPSDFWIRKGLGYVFLTSNNPLADWRSGMRSINDTKSVIGNTLAPVYNRTSGENLFHIIYNDDPPSTTPSLAHGHTKGVVISDGKQGIWLVHSTPNFPIEPVTKLNLNSSGPQFRNASNNYIYPESATKYGQSFLCITLTAEELNKVGNLLMYNRPKIYSVNIPNDLKENFPNLTLAANNAYIKTPPWHYKINLRSVAGSEFTAYAKTKQFQKDIYSGFVAPDLKSNLEVESWMNGPGSLPSDCKGNYTVKNVRSLGMRIEQNVIHKFRNSQDHSKWAVSDKDKKVICIGDINRMEAQLKRGGGTVCLKHSTVWSRYKKTIEEVEPCPTSLLNSLVR